eukprot:CAMPEP_0174264018 /NCGR_PEP_ID=MMETSP0439-20130205/20998_1 /TAXON_ID=0 /ORGANISM="Stereomyxa ramosa, Strain Chinc5" /LENGTH=311 /DNA_ID=CAMNT_0015349701 /DNA_START=590 /DNA_END=1522 /DNA_ORIENTATION=-
MFLRYIWENQLNPVLPGVDGWYLTYGGKFAAAPPPRFGHPYNAVVNHIVYERDTLEELIPNAIYLSVVRHPFDQSVSYWKYFGQQEKVERFKEKQQMPYSTKPPGEGVIVVERQVVQFLTELDQGVFGDQMKDHTNKMSQDFGILKKMNPADFADKQKVYKWGTEIANEFHHVLVFEHFFESLVLLKRIMNWQLSDVLMCKSNSLVHSKIGEKMGGEEKKEAIELHKKHNLADWMLYNYWNQTLWKKIDELPERESFMNEVEQLRTLTKQFCDFCDHRSAEKEVFSSLDSKIQVRLSRSYCFFLKRPIIVW